MIDILGPNGQALALWIQSLSNVVVLIFIYRQLGSIRLQMSQSDNQNRAERAWQFMRFYQDEVARTDSATEDFQQFFRVRIRVFSLLNQLIRFQQVDERLLFGFLSEEFLDFVERSSKEIGRLKFAETVSPRIMFLIATWGGEERIYGPKEGGVEFQKVLGQDSQGVKTTENEPLA